MHFILFAILFAAPPKVIAAAPVVHFVSAKYCRFEFDYPSNWQVSPLPPDKWTSCAVQVRPNNFDKLMAADDVDVYTLVVSVPGGGTFLDAASKAGFDFYQGSWVTRGRQGARGDATVINNKEWSGVRGTASVGCHHQHGGYAGLCEFDRVVLQDESGQDVWSMEGGPKTDAAFEVVLRSFTFRE